MNRPRATLLLSASFSLSIPATPAKRAELAIA